MGVSSQPLEVEQSGSRIRLRAFVRLSTRIIAGCVALFSLVAIMAVTPSHAGPGTPTLLRGEYLYAGQDLRSPNGLFRLLMQSDGNLVVYARSSPESTSEWAHWHTNTHGNPGAFAIMQPDGNFVVYRSDNYPLWDSDSWATPATHVKLQDDGNLVVYGDDGKPYWAAFFWPPDGDSGAPDPYDPTGDEPFTFSPRPVDRTRTRWVSGRADVVFNQSTPVRPWAACGEFDDKYKLVREYQRPWLHSRMDGHVVNMRCGKETTKDGESKFGFRHIRLKHQDDWESLSWVVWRNWRDLADWAIQWTLSDPDTVVVQGERRFCYQRVIALKEGSDVVARTRVVVLLGETGIRLMTAFPRDISKVPYCQNVDNAGERLIDRGPRA